MHIYKALIAAAFYVAGIQASCNNEDGSGSCYWRGTSPSCFKGDGYGDLCDNIGGEWLNQHTKDVSVSDLYKAGKISEQCYSDYGAGCWWGGKYLWCNNKPNHCP
ncbi:hypothetical protein N7541_000069 [Penicillium brevicompactum]|uniref:Uncharacterized protein n=1 Tax=Penicillium brevicompactum TaxID=5074 RepID=A0A9W9V278_PENBR|nr:hypothetical protein N7541_000069 [Penicillium brevicompactum]